MQNLASIQPRTSPVKFARSSGATMKNDAEVVVSWGPGAEAARKPHGEADEELSRGRTYQAAIIRQFSFIHRQDS